MLTRVSAAQLENDPHAASAASAPRYQIVIRQCEDCGRAQIATGRGVKPVSPKTLETTMCDARVHRKGEKNRATIPPSVRREVLARDGHQCRTAGCGSARFLDVHHVIPRDDGGSNDADNLITVCASCHRMIHERGKTAVAWPMRRCAAERHVQVDHPGDHGNRNRR
jgi:5-methylcytosine-specific restriction endonuclease McrA